MDQKRRKVVSANLASSLGKVVDSAGLSQRALRRVLGAVADESVSRRQLQHISKDRFEKVKCTMRFPKEGGGEVAFEMSHPASLLALVAEENAIFRTWLQDAWCAKPSSPSNRWRLLIGWDEFVPGNKMAIQNSRKTMVLSFSFIELLSHLHEDTAWITPLAVRSSLVQQVRGGWSAVLRTFLREMLLGPQGLHAAGHPVPVHGGQRLLFAEVHTLLSDGDGLRQALQWLGANATKPCFRHWNVLSRGSGLAERGATSARYVETTCSSPSAFCSWTGADLRQAADVLILAKRAHAAGELPYARVDEIQKAYGYRFTSDGTIADKDLGAIIDWPRAFHYDWVHVMLSGGVLMSATWSLLSGLGDAGLPGQQALHHFLKGWKCPRAAAHGSRDAGRLERFFDARSISENNKREGIRCNASELLSLSVVIEEFVATQVPDDNRVSLHIAFFKAARKSIDLLLMAKRGDAQLGEAASELEKLSADHIDTLVSLHGPEWVTPKFHWCFDVAQQLRSDEYVMDAFVIERLHLRARDISDRLFGMDAYESSLCAGLVNKMCNSDGTQVGLEGPTSQMPSVELAHVRIADRMYWHGKRFAVDDVVYRSDSDVGIVVACAEEPGCLALMVNTAAKVASTSRLGRRCRMGSGGMSVWSPADAHVAAAWRPIGSGSELSVLLR